ncbi:MAG: hypothetical protein DRI73_01545 [Bacteroidetes bacterium]|nr:MAG: hypothetical protein DRI73_01545 [Bacteroidota bacterium]
MEFKDKIEILFKEIQDIKNFVEIIKNNDQISQIESDILKSRIQGLYITLLELGKKESGSESISMEKDVSEFEKNYKVIEDLKPEPEQAEETFSDDMTFIEEIESLEIEEPTEVQVEEDESIEEIKEEDKVDEKQEPVSEPVTGQDDDGLIKNEKLEMENKVEDRIKQKSKEVVSDLYKNKQKYRNESLQKERVSSDISSKFHNNPITDIASSIGINDKFRYVRELFDGDSSKYSSTIEVLNQVSSEVDAVNYLKDNFSWDMEDKLVSRLLELTRRKLKIKGDD